MCLTYWCYLPNEWRSYSKSYLRRLVIEAAAKQWKTCRHIEGTTILLEGVSAKLQYHHFDIWLRKDESVKYFPQKEEYFRLRINCIVCATA